MYFSFVTRFILVFGIGFLFPVVLVGLNAVGCHAGQPADQGLAGCRRADLRLRGRGHADRRPVHDVRVRGPADRARTSRPGSSAASSTSARRRRGPTGSTSTTTRPRRSDRRTPQEQPWNGHPVSLRSFDVRTVVYLRRGGEPSRAGHEEDVDRPAPRPPGPTSRSWAGAASSRPTVRCATSPTRRSAGCRCGRSTSTRRGAWPSRTLPSSPAGSGSTSPAGPWRRGGVAFPRAGRPVGEQVGFEALQPLPEAGEHLGDDDLDDHRHGVDQRVGHADPGVVARPVVDVGEDRGLGLALRRGRPRSRARTSCAGRAPRARAGRRC